MFNYLENNWVKWYYDVPENQIRNNNSQKFIVEHSLFRDTTCTLRDSAIAACQSIRDTYPDHKFSIMLSGGSESEICLRAFQLAKVPFRVYIGRYENDINLYDVSYAVTLCESIGIPYTIIDFQLKKFLEKDAVQYGDYAQIKESRLLPQLALCDLVDGIPIMGGGEPSVNRLNADYTVKGTWLLEESETFWGWTKYFVRKNRIAIPEWCRWSSQLHQSWINLPWFQKLINDEYPGKLSIHSTKLYGYQQQFPELLPRVKKTGFESINYIFNELNKHLLLTQLNQCSYFYTVEGFFDQQIHSQLY
jgi:hypothetical protein